MSLTNDMYQSMNVEGTCGEFPSSPTHSCDINICLFQLHHCISLSDQTNTPMTCEQVAIFGVVLSAVIR